MSVRGVSAAKLLVSGLAAAVVFGGSLEASMGQEAQSGAFLPPLPVIAQQLVDVPAGRVAFVVTQQDVDAQGLTIPGDGPAFLVGTDGSSLVRPEGDGSTTLLGAQEAAALAGGAAYRIEPMGNASVLSIELDTNPPDSAGLVSDMYFDVAGLRDMELRRAVLSQQASLEITSESGVGLLLVLEGSVLVEEPDGASALLAAGDAIELDDSTPVSGIDPASVLLAVTLGNTLDLGGETIASAPGEDLPGTPGSPSDGQAGGSVPSIRVDSDGDGLYDDEEAALGSDPGNTDSDQDGLNDGDEVRIYGSSPTAPDTDGDMLPDYNEVTQQGTDPANPDTDGDGLSDHDELNYEGADPTMYDSDGDGLNDLEEVLAGSSSETDDYDGDGLTDFEEVKIYGSNPSAMDGDGDGLWDYNEVTDFQTNPANSDTDGDGRSDGFEVNDGSDPLDANSPAS